MTQKRSFGGWLMAIITPLITLQLSLWLAQGQDNNPVAVVSAANYSSPVAPDSIAAVFGTGLATRTEAASGASLPTTLAGTTVRINGELAPLFLVSPGQINLLVPPGTAAGTANVVVTAGDGAVSRGTVQIMRAAPGVFTANANGSGVPAALALRVRADGTQSIEPVVDFAQTPFGPRPLELGAANEQLFLILFGTGIRGRANLADVAVRIGGVNAAVNFAGAQGLAGLDQINVLLPRELLGRGRVNVALNVNGAGAANLVEVEIAGAASVAPPQVIGYSAPTALAGQLLTINGADFSPNRAENTVRIGGVEARVETASATQLIIRVPFGSQSGTVSVRTPRGEGQGAQALQMRTSISGVVEDTRRQPLVGVTVRAVGRGIQAVTGAEGSFILADVPAASAQELEFDGSAVSGSLPYPTVRLKKRVAAGRDNQMDGPVALQQISGPGVPVSSAAASGARAAQAAAASPAQIPAQTVRAGNVSFEIPAGATVSLPNGATRGTLNLTLVENNRPPVSLRPGVFSSTIPQLTPFNTILLPGGKLTLPNDERYPAGSQVTLYRFDQTPGSPTLGEFVEAGTATVTADGQRIETAANAITEITQYFVAAPRQTTSVTGRVVDGDGVTPVRQALVRCRGQEAFTDGNGGFTLRSVVVNPGDTLAVEASFVRANGRVDRTQRSGIAAVVGGLTVVTPDLVLPAEDSNRPPVVLAPAALLVNEGELREVNFVALDPDANQTIQLSLTGASFATLVNRGNNIYTLRLQTGANDAGRYTLALVATDNQALSTRLNIALTVNRPPVANPQSVTTNEDTPRAITLTGSDAEGDPLSYTIVTNPLHGQLSGNPPNVLYTPAARYNGADSFTFKVNDGLADSLAAIVSIAVNPVNHPPVLTVPAAQTINEGQELSFTISASDVDAGQALSFTAANLPGGANFAQTSGTTARLTWTPSFTQAGNYTVAFTVRDNGVPALSDSKAVTITVNDVNQPPDLTVPPAQTATAGQTLSFTIAASDPDAGQAVTVAAMDLPAGATFDAINREFRWTPTVTQVGQFVVSFKASDNGTPPLSTTKSVTITVGLQWAATAGIDGGIVATLASTSQAVFAGSPGGGIFRTTNQGQSWTAVNVGLGNTDVRVLATAGSSLLAGTIAGIYRSTDNGQTWTFSSTGIGAQLTLALAVSETTLFAGTNGSGVYRSTNNGQSWTQSNTGLPANITIRVLTVNGANLFAGIQQQGVFRSTNEGQSWQAVNTGLPANSTVNALAISGTNIFAPLGASGLFVSANAGANWTAVTSLPQSFVYTVFATGASIFASTSLGVYRSNNNGQSWTLAYDGMDFNALAFTGNEALLFGGTFNGVYRTTNNGQRWERTNNGLNAGTITTLAANGNNLVAGGNGLTPNGYGINGVFVSNNSGASWALVRNGLTRSVYSQVVKGNDFFAGTIDDGVYRSTDNGQSWSRANRGLPAGTWVLSLAVNGAQLLAGTNGTGVFVSADDGQNWTPTGAGLANLAIRALAVSGGTLFAGAEGRGVYRSTDNGQSWTAVNTGLSDLSVNCLAVNGGNLYAGTNTRVFRSTDGGQSWAPFDTGMPIAVIYALAVTGNQGLFAATLGGQGVYFLPNQGSSWLRVSAGLPATSIYTIALSGARVFVGTQGNGVYATP